MRAPLNFKIGHGMDHFMCLTRRAKKQPYRSAAQNKGLRASEIPSAVLANRSSSNSHGNGRSAICQDTGSGNHRWSYCSQVNPWIRRNYQFVRQFLFARQIPSRRSVDMKILLTSVCRAARWAKYGDSSPSVGYELLYRQCSRARASSARSGKTSCRPRYIAYILQLRPGVAYHAARVVVRELRGSDYGVGIAFLYAVIPQN